MSGRGSTMAREDGSPTSYAHTRLTLAPELRVRIVDPNQRRAHYYNIYATEIAAIIPTMAEVTSLFVIKCSTEYFRIVQRDKRIAPGYRNTQTMTCIPMDSINADRRSVHDTRWVHRTHPTNSLFLFGISSLLKLTFSSSSFSFSTRARASGTTSLQSVRKLPGLAVAMA